MTWVSEGPTFLSCSPAARSSDVSTAAGAGLIGSGALLRGERLLAAVPALDPRDPEVPNEQVAKILKDLFGDRPIRRGHMSLDMPAVAEDGRIVPVIIESDLPMTAEQYVKAVHLIVDHNPDPHLAAYHLTPALGSSGPRDPDQDEADHLGPGDPRDLERRRLGRLRPRQRLAQRMRLMTIGEARIRVPDRISKGDLIRVNAIVAHPMDTGFFRTANGQPIPAFFIKDVAIAYGETEVARFEWTSGISKDPVVSFTLKADREAPLTITWTDTKGGVYKQSASIAFAAA